MIPDTYYTKENIAQRVLKRSAELWGYDDSNMDQFDPLVKLLIEGCSVELEKIGHEIQGTELRLMTRLAEILCPDIERNPRPAIAIAQSRPLEPKGFIDPEIQLVCRRNSVRKEEAAEVFFSSTGKYPLVNAGIIYYATPVGLYQYDKGARTLLAPSIQQKGGEQCIWIGLDVDPSITSWSGFRFYFDWPAEVSSSAFGSFLPLVKIQFQQNFLDFEIGLKTGSEAEEIQFAGIVNRFLKITSTENWEKGKLPLSLYPDEFEDQFDQRNLQTLKRPLAWLKLTWPAAFPISGFENIKVILNAFPVCNKQLHKLTYRLQSGLNGIALPAADAFIGINSIFNQKNEPYTASDKNNTGEGGNTYTIRQQGIGRLDKRDAKAFLYQLMELLRDEVTAFNAIGEDYLASILREISQNMARVEQKLGPKRTRETSSQPFLVVRGEKNPDQLYISYWTTAAELANGFPVGSKLQSYSASSLNNVETLLITTSLGGKAAPEETEYVSALRKNVVTRGRLITPEDIRIYCEAELGPKIKKTIVRPHFMKGNLPGQGFVRCIQVQLTPSGSAGTTPEWIQSCDTLKAKIEKLSSGMYPVELVTTAL